MTWISTKKKMKRRNIKRKWTKSRRSKISAKIERRNVTDPFSHLTLAHLSLLRIGSCQWFDGDQRFPRWTLEMSSVEKRRSHSHWCSSFLRRSIDQSGQTLSIRPDSPFHSTRSRSLSLSLRFVSTIDSLLANERRMDFILVLLSRRRFLRCAQSLFVSLCLVNEMIRVS